MASVALCRTSDDCDCDGTCDRRCFDQYEDNHVCSSILGSEI